MSTALTALTRAEAAAIRAEALLAPDEWQRVAGMGSTDERVHRLATACTALLDQRITESRARQLALLAEYEAGSAVRDHTSPLVGAEELIGHTFKALAAARLPWDDYWLAPGSTWEPAQALG